jgi:hypothetical protein
LTAATDFVMAALARRFSDTVQTSGSSGFGPKLVNTVCSRAAMSSAVTRASSRRILSRGPSCAGPSASAAWCCAHKISPASAM